MVKAARVGALLLLLVVLPTQVRSQRSPTHPRLVLVLVIDQMRFDYLTRFDPLFEGGLRTLLDRGATFTNARYRHSSNETGPGHSVILSGRHPSHSGIVANEWYDPYLKKVLNVVDDPVQSPVGGRGRGASPANFHGFTIGDALKLRSPRSHVVGVSLKDRSAVLMAGRRGDAAYWYEVDGGNFITSSYYMTEAPDWLVEWNSGHLADSYVGRQWTRLLPEVALYDRYAGKDAVEGEWDRKDVMFPHKIRGNPPERAYYDDLRRTPFADELTLSIALAARDAYHLGEDDDTDIFAIGFSATDIIGHTYGPDSHEAMDQLLRLDRLLGRLFTEIESRVGLANTLVVLTSDHGVMPLVEVLEAKGVAATRVSPRVLQGAVREALARKYPGADDLIAYFATDVYFDEEAIRRRGLDLGEIEATATVALMSTGVVQRVYTQAELASVQSSSDPFLPLFRNAFYQPRSPHLSVLVKPYVYVDARPGGTGHGTAHDYDRHIPIVLMSPVIRRGTYDDESGPEDIAPTLARILDLNGFPHEADSRVLAEVLSFLNAP